MIPVRYEHASYDDVPQNIKDLMREMRTTKKGIYIHGSVGCGKTHLICALEMKYRKVTGKIPSFWNTSELFQAIKDDFDKPHYDKVGYLEALMSTENLLFLDDIGSEKATDWVQEQFYILINKRYADMKPIVFTSNYSIAELAAQIGDRTASRIVEMCHVTHLEGEDRRLSTG